jgi:hypothetical protein
MAYPIISDYPGNDEEDTLDAMVRKAFTQYRNLVKDHLAATTWTPFEYGKYHLFTDTSGNKPLEGVVHIKYAIWNEQGVCLESNWKHPNQKIAFSGKYADDPFVKALKLLHPGQSGLLFFDEPSNSAFLSQLGTKPVITYVEIRPAKDYYVEE